MTRTLRLLLISLVCFVVALSAVAQPKKETAKSSLLTKKPYIPDIATFLQIGACSPAGISWDGKDVYFTASNSGEPQVYRITDDGWPYQLTTFEDGVGGFNLNWAGDLAFVTAAVGGNENEQVFLLDPKTGRIQQLIDKPEVQYSTPLWSRDDKFAYFRSNEENLKDFFIYRMNMATGDYEKVFGDTVKGVRGSNSISDLSDDGTVMIVGNYTSNVNNDLYWLDLKTLKYEKLTTDSGDVVYGDVSLMPDNRTIWLTSNDNPSGMSKIAIMTVADKSISYVDDGWFDSKWEVEGLGFSRDFKVQYASINEDGYAKLYIREAATRNPIANPPLEGLLGAAGSDMNGNIFVTFSSATRAPDIWKWNPATKELTQLTHSIYAGIDREMFKEPQLVRFKSFDGLEIPAFLYLPPSWKKGSPVPFIVDAHGGPEGQARPSFIRNYQYLMLNGYGVLAVNPRGSSGYGRDFMALDNYKKRKDSLKDYKAAADWLVSQGYSAKGQMAIRGGSYGGYVSLGMITEYPELFSAAVCNVGIANFVTFLQNTAAYRRALREAEYGPLSDEEFLASISPVHKAKDIKTPLLIVHGANDPRVPIDEARQMAEAIRSNGGIVDTLIFADEGHGSAKRENTIIEYRKQVEFFDTYLKPKKVRVRGE